MMSEYLTVTDEHAGARADVFISAVTELSRSAAARLIEEGSVLLREEPVNKKTRLAPGDILLVHFPDPVPTEAQPEDIPLDIIYEDADIIVVNKPTGMVVHPAAGNESGTLVNALLYHCGDTLSGIGGVIRPGIVHRIDKDTSGLLVVAKNDAAHTALSAQLKGHAMGRVYDAILLGNLKEDQGVVDAPIGRHPTDRKKMAILRGDGVHSRDALTHYTVTERFSVAGHGAMTRVRCELETGRTHQIRVHMASIGHPLAGDEVYGKGREKTGLDGQCLHAGRLRFIHPDTGEAMEVTCPLPEYFTKFEEKLRLIAE